MKTRKKNFAHKVISENPIILWISTQDASINILHVHFEKYIPVVPQDAYILELAKPHTRSKEF